MVRNIWIRIEYDGTGFSGWQRQPNRRTVQGEIEKVLSRINGSPMTIDGVSRTDAGVHAMDQYATFQWDVGIPVERIPKVLNDAFSTRMLDGDIRVTEAKEMPMDFHARFDSKGKRYRYRIWSGKDMPVFLRNYRYHVREQLDVEAMKNGAKAIQGVHDFACFQAAGGTPRETTVRHIYRLDVEVTESAPNAAQAGTEAEGGQEISLVVSGDGFLYNMVRIITGTLVDVGLGKIAPEDVAAIIESKDRRKAGHTAPPQGLYLEKVFYQEGEE